MQATDKTTIVNALAGKLKAGDPEMIADVLCQAYAAPQAVAVIDDDTEPAVSEDGTPSLGSLDPRVQILMTDRDHQAMLSLPSRLFASKWFNGLMDQKLGREESTSFFACMYGEPDAVREPVFLAAVLEEAYGKQDLEARMDAAVFSNVQYAAIKADALPYLEKYFYA